MQTYIEHFPSSNIPDKIKEILAQFVVLWFVKSFMKSTIFKEVKFF